MYNRIAIVGGSGSGKSTLCTILSKKLNLPEVHLDGLNFEANWKQVNKEKRNKEIIEIAKSEKWIIDGNYEKTLEYRFKRADLIIWLDYTTFAQLKGVLKRILKGFNKERYEIPGCRERLNFKFIKYVITYNKNKRKVIIENLKYIPKQKVLVFKSQKELNQWLKVTFEN